MISYFPCYNTILINLALNPHTPGKDVHQFANLYHFRSSEIHQVHGHLGHRLQRPVHFLLYQVKMATLIQWMHMIQLGHKLLPNHLLLLLRLPWGTGSYGRRLLEYEREYRCSCSSSTTDNFICSFSRYSSGSAQIHRRFAYDVDGFG